MKEGDKNTSHTILDAMTLQTKFNNVDWDSFNSITNNMMISVKSAAFLGQRF